VRVSPLQFAVKVKAPKCVEVLLECGADIKMRLKTPENKSLPITALQLAEGERDVAIKNKRENDIETYDDIVRLIKEHEKNKKKKKKKKTSDSQKDDGEQKAAGESTTIADAKPNGSPYSIDTKSLNQLGAGGDHVTVASTGSIGGGSMPMIVPPSPSSSLDMHKVTLRAAQNHLAIKKLEEKNDHLQKEVEQLKQDVDGLKQDDTLHRL